MVIHYCLTLTFITFFLRADRLGKAERSLDLLFSADSICEFRKMNVEVLKVLAVLRWKK